MRSSRAPAPLAANGLVCVRASIFPLMVTITPAVADMQVQWLPCALSCLQVILPVTYLISSSALKYPVMPQTPNTATASSESRFQAIFQAALKSYQKQTKKDILAHPLASQLQACNSTSAIIAFLQDQVREFDKSESHGDGERLTKWLNPTVNVLCAFSAAVSGGVGLVRLDTERM
jgi:hypothetical protein